MDLPFLNAQLIVWLEGVRMISGTIDYLKGNVIAGWIRGPYGGASVVVTLDGVEHCVPLEEVTTDDPKSDARHRFKFSLPRVVEAGHLIDGTLTIETKFGEVRSPLKVWNPLKIAAEINSIDTRILTRAMSFIRPDRLDVLRLASSPTWSWPRIPSRSKLAVLAYANGADGWFPYFYRHYMEIAGAQSIFIVTPRPEQFAGLALGGVISVAGMPYDNSARAEMMSRLSAGLLAYFEWTLVCDIDEIVIPDPRSGLDFIQSLSACEGVISITRGFEILQRDEADFDASRPVLEQRQLAIANSAYCKPHLSKVPVRYANGYHYCDERPKFEPFGSGFLTLHMKWACRAMRQRVASLVASTPYSDEGTAARTYDGVTAQIHPALREGEISTVPLNAENFSSFEEEYMRKLAFMPGRQHWGIGYFYSKHIFDLGKN